MDTKTISLSDDDWIVIDQALQRMPYGQVAGIYQRINAQMAAQAAEALAEAEPAEEPEPEA